MWIAFWDPIHEIAKSLKQILEKNEKQQTNTHITSFWCFVIAFITYN